MMSKSEMIINCHSTCFKWTVVIWFDSFKANYEPTLKKQFHFIYASKSPKEDFGRVLIIALFPLGTNDEKN